MPRPAPSLRRAQGGFTLIELSIVLLIIGFISYFTIPKLRSVAAVELKGSSRRLANATRVLFDEASLRGTVYVLNVDLDRQGYWVSKLDPATGQFVADDDLVTGKVLLPPDVRIADMVLPGVGKIAAGTGPVRFFPEGYADRAVIHLADVLGHAYTLAVDPIRGRTEVREGYIDASPAS